MTKNNENDPHTGTRKCLGCGAELERIGGSNALGTQSASIDQCTECLAYYNIDGDWVTVKAVKQTQKQHREETEAVIEDMYLRRVVDALDALATAFETGEHRREQQAREAIERLVIQIDNTYKLQERMDEIHEDAWVEYAMVTDDFSILP